ncbi:hypothetical protein F5876DRAFT_73163 [Lentinula aff. lateritia]|uniref:Uncharacterized protein n=1 Tax=Lentinula aff. lateritia TaxID=2804960 RepID=A0ACC1UBH3_9AGAR|nr:hypothetical protein F5876DRAFT_73163 [Lentinula aff. lateritia]
MPPSISRTFSLTFELEIGFNGPYSNKADFRNEISRRNLSTPPSKIIQGSDSNASFSNNTGSNSTNSGNQPPRSNGNGNGHNVDVVGTTSKATIVGSILSGIIGIALMVGLLWWLWRSRKSRKTSGTQKNWNSSNTRNPKSWTRIGWKGWKGLQRQGNPRRLSYAQDAKKRPPIDGEDDYSDSSQMLQTLPTPATHLSLPSNVYIPGPQIHHARRREHQVAANVAGSASEDPILPPRYWQIHNSPSAASLHRDLSSNKSVGLTLPAPVPPPSSADHGHSVLDLPPASSPHFPDQHSFSLTPSHPFPPSLTTTPVFNPSSTAQTSPLSPASLSISDSHPCNVPLHNNQLTLVVARADDPPKHPLESETGSASAGYAHSTSPISSVSHESELTIRHLRHQVEVLAEENARLSRQSYVLLTRGMAGEVVRSPPAYAGDLADENLTVTLGP